MTDPDGLLDYAQIAALLTAKAGKEVKVSSVRGYRTRGQMPEPDVWLADRPRWYPATITEWMKTRPGKGARTDLTSKEQP